MRLLIPSNSFIFRTFRCMWFQYLKRRSIGTIFFHRQIVHQSFLIGNARFFYVVCNTVTQLWQRALYTLIGKLNRIKVCILIYLFFFQHWLRATSNPNNLKGDKLLINVNNIYLLYFNLGNACNTWFKLLYLGNLNFRVL